jgi:SAM-dependent methyltransferase
MDYKNKIENDPAAFVQDQTPEYYQKNAEKLARDYSKGDTGIEIIVKKYNTPGSRVLDIGCGSGRDLDRLEKAGYCVHGVDSSQEMITQAEYHYPNLKTHLTVSTLPELGEVKGQFRAVLCSAVIQHIKNRELYESFQRIFELTEDKGIFIISFPDKYPGIDKHTSLDPAGRLFNIRSSAQYQFLLERLGFCLIEAIKNEDSLKREDVSWLIQVYRKEPLKIRTPLNIIDTILREESKTTTYKFALLRALAETATYSYKVAEWRSDGNIGVDLDLIAMKWIQYYWPLVTCDPLILQGQFNKANEKSDISFRSLLADFAKSLGPGGYQYHLTNLAARNLAQVQKNSERVLLNKVKQTIIKGPVFYSGDLRAGEKPFICQDGKLIMRAELWIEFVLMGRWIEDSIILRWADFTASLPYNKNRGVKPSRVLDLLLSSLEIKRDVGTAEEILSSFPFQNCVWTGKRVNKWDIDHALPFSLWRNNDIWNLFPSDSKVNRQKSDRLPSRQALIEAKKRIFSYWDLYYEKVPNLFLNQAGLFCGEKYSGYGRSVRDTLFYALSEAVETEALRQSAPRWTP